MVVPVEPVDTASRWTTRRWLRVSVGLALTVLLVLGALGAWALVRASQVTDTLVNRSTPALVDALRLQGALLDQETGIRGYGLSGDPALLEPYLTGVADANAAVDRLRPLLTDDADARRDLAGLLATAEEWQTAVAQPISAAPAGAPALAESQRVGNGKQLFDKVREAAAAQQGHLQDKRADAARALDAAETQRNAVFAAAGALILVIAVLSFEGLRRGVTAPLEHLSADVRAVREGDFTHPVEPTGPSDLRALARDVEGMRQRLADELDFNVDARRRLDTQAEELRRSNAELEQFAYVASHDLQEPLRKVASFCQLLQRRYGGQLDERADQYIGFAVDGANRMQALINDLLAFSRVGRLDSDHAPVDLEEVYARTVDILSLVVEETGAEITHDPLPTLTANPAQMGMLLQNLLGNAVKFRAPDRVPRIHLSAARDGDVWQFAVTDNGIGIAPDYAEKVFVIFQRLHAKDAYPGNGIGLAMCKKIVEYHGGSISVDPGHTDGARIAFTLRADAAEGESPNGVASPPLAFAGATAREDDLP